jgi:glycosyltransferase involved in cell wall biosynthesis
MKINIIGVDNGVGLTQDFKILKEVFKAHQVNFIDYYSGKGNSKAHVNIWLECVSNNFFNLAKTNILIPNPEWFYPQWDSLLHNFDYIFAKTRQAERIFKDYNVIYTGFTSLDKYKKVNKTKVFLHTAGKSDFKSTLQTYQALNGTDIYSVITKAKGEYKDKRNPNLYVNIGYFPGEKMEFLQNSCLIHICCSNAEGFGHYINEAMSCGNVVLTMNGEPMNELITNETGYFVEPTQSMPLRKGIYYTTTKKRIKIKLKEIDNTDIEILKAKGKAARELYLQRDKEFKERIINIINNL